MVDLENGDVSLEVCVMLKDDLRVERLLSLYECHQEVFSPGLVGNSKLLKTLVAIRMAEVDEYHQAAEDLKTFKSHFDQVNIY